MASTTQQSEHPQPEPWVFPPETTLLSDKDYVDLEVIDASSFLLSSQKGQPPSREEVQTRQDIASRVVKALSTIGFFALKGLGLSHADFRKQFDLGKLLVDDAAEEDKKALTARIKEEQSWAGYKQPGYHIRADGAWDSLEHYDFYPFTARASRLPAVARPYLDDFRNFIEFNHYDVLRKVLAMISIGLGMEEETFWKLHHIGEATNRPLQCGPDDEIRWPHSKDHLRYAMYHPPSEEDRVKTKNIWLIPHTDRGSVTFIYSQPIAGLQVLTADNQWKYIRHYPDHIIVDTGDCLNFLTGGVIKAPAHRVREPPEDQRHLRRLGIFYFVPFLPDTPVAPIDHPALRARGAQDIFEEYRALGGEPMTVNDWLRLRTKLIGTKRERREKREAMDALEDIHYRYTWQDTSSTY